MQGEWINTGDKYYIDDKGYYWCAGRVDDMLKGRRHMGFTRRNRKLPGTHPRFRECSRRLQDDQTVKPKAFVVLREGFSPLKNCRTK